MLAKNMLLLLVNLVGICDLCNSSHHQLSAQREALAQFSVARLVQIVLPESLGLECLRGKPIACRIATLKRSAQSALLLWRRLQTKVGNKFHISSMEDFRYAVKQRTADLRTARYPSPA